MTAAGAPSPPSSTDLAIERTWLAHERTMMAWVRTATSLISFGFTLHKFFQYQIQQGQAAAASRLLGPREFALVMIGTGLVALALATFQHRRGLQTLSAGHAKQPRSVAAVVASLIAALGLLAFVATLFHL
jgi:putative membrane protein